MWLIKNLIDCFAFHAVGSILVESQKIEEFKNQYFITISISIVFGLTGEKNDIYIYIFIYLFYIFGTRERNDFNRGRSVYTHTRTIIAHE
jgi:uncharacterized protein (DUF2225 family)